ncbi:MAG: GHKL domain-containing protein [Lachnospiraceae bacterium]|nr:GHKL domain-containing protein [Lachnospiraceae bacterium]
MEIIYSILDAMLVLFFLKVIKSYVDSFRIVGYEPGKKAVPVWIFYAGFQIAVVLTKAEYPMLNGIVSIISVILLCMAESGVSFRTAMIKGALFFGFYIALEGIVYYVFTFLGILGNDYGFMMANMVCKMLMYFVMELVLLSKSSGNHQEIVIKHWLPLLSVPLAYSLTLLYIYGRVVEGELSVLLFLLTAAMLISNYLVFETYNHLLGQAETERQNLLYAQQLNLCNQQAMEREAAYQETQRVRHDLKNYLWNIRFSLENGDVEEAQKQIDQILEKNELYKNEVAKTGNLVLDSLINYRCAVAARQDILMRCSIEVPRELEYDGADLSIILGNLIDNAVEAVKELPREKRYIEVNMGILKGSLMITVKNPFEGEIKKESSGRLLTRKKDKKNHGIGLSSVAHVVEKYNGELMLKHDDHIFSAELLLYPPEAV